MSLGGVLTTPDPNTSAKYCDANGSRMVIKMCGGGGGGGGGVYIYIYIYML